MTDLRHWLIRKLGGRPLTKEEIFTEKMIRAEIRRFTSVATSGTGTTSQSNSQDKR